MTQRDDLPTGTRQSKCSDIPSIYLFNKNLSSID